MTANGICYLFGRGIRAQNNTLEYHIVNSIDLTVSVEICNSVLLNRIGSQYRTLEHHIVDRIDFAIRIKVSGDRIIRICGILIRLNIPNTLYTP